MAKCRSAQQNVPRQNVPGPATDTVSSQSHVANHQNRGRKAKLARRNTAGFEKLQKARGKLNIMRILGAPEPTPGSVDQMSHDLQQVLNKSVDLYAIDVCKWVKIFWSDPILERRVDALSEIGWGAYLCGRLLQNDLARSEGFLEGVLKVARTMCGRPVAPMLRATMVGFQICPTFVSSIRVYTGLMTCWCSAAVYRLDVPRLFRIPRARP